MDNLFIIGNGFDKAHGLKTSYQDFLNDLIHKINKDPYQYSDLVRLDSIEVNVKGHKQSRYKNKLMHFLNQNSENNQWSDIEYLYFKILQNHNNPEYFDEKFNVNNPYIHTSELNQEFEQIKEHLINYLIEEQTKFIAMPEIEDFFRKFNYEQTTILNFNYTNTVQQYLNEFKKINHIQIHGELQNNDNPIVFGFAAKDDDSKYLIDQDDNNLMKNIKKINYKLSNNENKLRKELSESKKVDIFILGHSCGISDIHILNQILNSDNIFSVRVFHYNGQEGFRNSIINIDRIIDDYSKPLDKRKVWHIVKSFPECCAMIQHDSCQRDKDCFAEYVADIHSSYVAYKSAQKRNNNRLYQQLNEL